jgi:CelD/BcsL family acetyltransferase involved in cellulose biosynthesis
MEGMQVKRESHDSTDLDLQTMHGSPPSVPSLGLETTVSAGGTRPVRTDKREKTVRYLEPEEYAQWDELVNASPQGTIFCQSWWLKAISADVRILGYFGGQHLIAGIPLYIEKRFGFEVCTMPPLSQTWGVVIEPLAGRQASKASRELEILRALARELSERSIFFQAFHPTLRNWLPFHWRGFKQTTRFTYTLDDLTCTRAIWKGMRPQRRSEIRKAERLGIIVKTCDIETVFQAAQKMYRHRGIKQPFTLDYLRRLYEAAKSNSAAECFAAYDRAGQIHAVNFLVWDSKRAYVLLAAREPKGYTTGAQSLLIWHMIRFASERTRVFDFEGSVLMGVECFFRGFGATRIPYSLIMKFPLWLRLYLILIHKL